MSTREHLEKFQAEVQAFCRAELPAQLRSKVLLNQVISKSDYVNWQKALRRRGWFGAQWPLEYGGQGWSKLQQWVFEETLYTEGAPWLIPFGVTYVGPVIYNFGSEAQKRKFLPAILESDTWWCQGYSEPNAGSDLANLSTRAMKNGAAYVLNGQKTWTTMAQWADKIFVLARTSKSARAQDGISFFLVDLQSPGITVRPIKSIDRCEHLNEVFFDDVRVLADRLVGVENQGWAYAKFLLSNERLLAADVAKSRRMIGHLVQLIVQSSHDFTPHEIRHQQRKIAELEVELIALEALCREFLDAADTRKTAGAEVSLLKIIGSELSQKISNMSIDVIGRQGMSYQVSALNVGGVEYGLQGVAGAVREYLHGRATTIYGGSNEIQRNIIAKSVLGL